MKATQIIFSSAKKFLHNHSGTILTVVGTIGFIGTVALTIHETPKAMKALEEAEDEKGDDLTKLEIVINSAPTYMPVAISAGASIACFAGANYVNGVRISNLSSMCGLIENSFQQYRTKLIELHGPEADIEVRDALARTNCAYHCIDPDIPENKLIWYDDFSGNSIERYERDIIDAEYHLNRNFALMGCVSLNDFYGMVGFPLIEGGDEMVWSYDEGYQWIDFEHRLVNRDDCGTPIYSIDWVFEPVPYDELV